MPELPEVETVVRDLNLRLPEGAVVAAFNCFRPDLRFVIPEGLGLQLVGSKLVRVGRRSKYILFEFDRGTLLSHLGMTGQWRYHDSELSSGPFERKSHDHIVVEFVEAKGRPLATLVYNDPRRFGYIDWSVNLDNNVFIQALGPEPLSHDFSPEYLFRSTRSRKTTIKVHLMNAKNVVGIGNIYASEILFAAGVRPTRRTGSLTRKECERIVASTEVVLNQAIRSGGSSIRDYVSASGNSGEFQLMHNVYGRPGENCRRCKEGQVRSRFIAGRSTFWCPKCQS
jgi:formamidopyrimidine-DNA glycosylase